MKSRNNDLILSKITRAKQLIKESELLYSNEYYNSAINRLYYACYNAVSAFLLTKDLTAKTHKGLKILFNKHCSKQTNLSFEEIRLFSILMDKRHESDYGDFVSFEKEETEFFQKQVENFVSKLSSLTSNL